MHTNYAHSFTQAFTHTQVINSHLWLTGGDVDSYIN